MLDFALSQTGPGDFCFAFDGRSRTCRKDIEEAVCKKNNYVLGWVVYQGGKVRGEAYALCANNREVFFVSLPAPRNRLETKERQGSYNACGETSTHYNTYSGVPLRNLREIWSCAPVDIP